MGPPRRALLRIDAFRLALAVGLSMAVLHGLDVLWSGKGSHLPVISRIEHAAQDYVLTTLRGARAASGDVVIVAIDERSIEAEGLWPWSRATMAELVERLRAAGVRAMGFDMIWSDDDRQGRRLAALAGEADPTRRLADAVERGHDVTLGFMFRSDAGAPAAAADAARKMDFYRAGPLQELDAAGQVGPAPGGRTRMAGRAFPGLVTPVDELVQVADSAGFFTVLPDADGVIRRYHLLASAGGSTFPSLGLALLARHEGQGGRGEPMMDGIPAEILPVGVAGSSLLVGVRVGALEIATDDFGRAPLNYYGSYRDFPTVSATDVLRGRLPAKALAGKVVLIGTTAPGTWDQRVTPFDDIAPGVITHATFVDNVLHGQLLERSQWVVMGEVLAMVLAAMGLAWLFSRVGPLAAAPALGVVLAVWAAVAVLALRRFNLVLASGLPLLQVLTMFLTATTYRFFSEERQKRKARESFSRFLAPAIVDEVLANEGSLRLGGEKRELTALFTDIRGFTSISEQLDPHRLLDLLNQYLTPMTDVIVSRHQGTLDKYMGDAIMAFWGAPRPQPDHALRACRAALDMVAELDRLRVGWRAQGLPDIDIGVGLNTGPMSVGFVGSQDRFYNYTILGDAVNLASRLEGANRYYGTRIIIGPETFARVREQVVTRQLDLVRVKGKLEPVAVHELLALAPASPALARFVEEFDWGYTAWQAQRWEEAISHFEEAERLRGGDECARLYVERCRRMQAAPPGAGWDGVTVLESK